MISFGQKLKERYVETYGFLSSRLQEKEILARSTTTPRTEESIQNLFLGLYPKDILPGIVTHTPVNEPMWYETSNCQRLKDLFRNFHRSVEFREYMGREVPDLEKKMTKYLQMKDKDGNTPTGRDWVIQLYDFMKCYQSLNENHSLPSDVPQQYFNSLEEISIVNWFEAFRSKEISKLGIGRFLGEIVTHMDQKISGKSDLKLIVYSGHDTSVGPLLLALEVFDNKWPPIASNLIFELFREKKDPKNYFVRMIYNDKVIQLPNCNSSLCPLKEFKEKANQVIPKDFERECQM